MAAVKPTVVGGPKPERPRVRPEPGLAEAMRRYDAEGGDAASRDRFKYTAQMLNRLYGADGVREKFGVSLYDLAKTWRSTDHYKIMKRKIAQLESNLGRPLTKSELHRVVRRVLDDLAKDMRARREKSRQPSREPRYAPPTTPTLPLPDLVRELAEEA